MAAPTAIQTSVSAEERPRLEPDLNQARRFLTLLDEDADGFTFQTATDSKPSDKPKPDPLARHVNLSPDNLAMLGRRNAEHRAAVWLCINATDGRGRKRENVTLVRAVFLDGDGQVALDQLLSFALEPHIVVESSPGHYQAYWLVAGLVREQFEGVQRCIAKTFGDADSIVDLCRVMRVPGFWHQKDPARPFQVRIVHEGARLPYKPTDILRAFPPLSEGRSRTATTQALANWAYRPCRPSRSTTPAWRRSAPTIPTPSASPATTATSRARTSPSPR